jgi:hypothetical protein
MVLEKGILALSTGTRRPNEGDFDTGIDEIKGRKNGDVEAGHREFGLRNGRHRHALCKRNRFRLQPLACMINDGIASIINKRLKHSENRRQTRVSQSAQRICCVDVAGKLECEWYLRHPVEGIGHPKGEARIAKPALKIAGIMIVAWLRLRVDIGLVGIILFFGRIGGVRKIRPSRTIRRAKPAPTRALWEAIIANVVFGALVFLRGL